MYVTEPETARTKRRAAYRPAPLLWTSSVGSAAPESAAELGVFHTGRPAGRAAVCYIPPMAPSSGTTIPVHPPEPCCATCGLPAAASEQFCSDCASRQPGCPPLAATSAPVQGSNGFAIASLVTGLVFVGLFAVIFGHIAHSQIRKSGHRQGGWGMATAGLVLGYIELSVVAVLLGLAFLLPLLARLP